MSCGRPAQLPSLEDQPPSTRAHSDAAIIDKLRSLKTGGPAGRPTPDAGSQYTSIRFTETLALQGLSASVGTVGDALDNAAAESTIGLYKYEAIAAGSPFRTGPLRTLADVETLTMSYVHWYNTDRLHGQLANVSPEEYEQAYYASLPGAADGDAADRWPA